MPDINWQAMAHRAEESVSRYRACFDKLESILQIGHVHPEQVVAQVEQRQQRWWEAERERTKCARQLACLRLALRILQGEDVVPEEEDE